MTCPISSAVKSAKVEIKMEDFDKVMEQVVVDSNEKFHKGFFDVVKDTSKNQILSSYSLSSVLGMILQGADGKTALQLRKSLGLEEDNSVFCFHTFDDFVKNYKLVANQLKSNENFTLNFANR